MRAVRLCSTGPATCWASDVNQQPAPIAYFAFNRPAHAARSLAALAANPEAVDPKAHPPDCLTPGCGPGPLVWQVAEDAGVPGLVAYLALWLSAAALVVGVWRRANGWTRALAAGSGAALLATLVYGLADAIALGAKPSVLYWVLLALLVALWKLDRRHPTAAARSDEASSPW